jgi:cytochrome bd-type quinol oxidase subunit 2
MPTWIIILFILAPIVAIGLNLILRKPLNESVKKRRLISTIVFFALIFFIACLSVYYSLSLYGNLSGVSESLKDIFTNWAIILQLLLFVLLFFYQFFRKDKKSQETSDQKSK